MKGADLTAKVRWLTEHPAVIRSASRGADVFDEPSLDHSEPPYPAQSLAPIEASILRAGADLLKVRDPNP